MRALFVFYALFAPAFARHTLQWGPTPSTRFSLDVSWTPSSSAAYLGNEDPRERAQGIASEFVTSLLGEDADFRFESGALSSSNGIYSAHFRQRHRKRDIVTGTLNVNVDWQGNRVVSYGNAFVDADAACATMASDYQTRDPGQSPQVVLGHVSQEATAGICSQREETIVDPRLALISLLLPIRAADGTYAIVSDDHLDGLLDSMTIEHPIAPLGTAAENHVLIHNAPLSIQPTEAKLAYMVRDNALELVWEFVYHSNDNTYNGFVAAEEDCSLEMLAITDWVRDFAPTDDIPEWPNPVPPRRPPHKAPEGDKPPKHPTPMPDPVDPKKAQYLVFPWGCNDPSICDREVVTYPADAIASPQGWHAVPAEKTWRGRAREADWMDQAGWSSKLGGGLNSTDTRGNNVFAQDNPTGGTTYELNYRPTHLNLSFEDRLHWGPKENRTGRDIEPSSYIAASVTELFFTINMMHDLTYRYGFDEESGNFQQVNDKTGLGLGGDPVIAFAQDGSGFNNANFLTGPDGQPGRMRMYVWNGDKPWRDGDLEAGIVIHEMMHGVSTRLTGPPSNPSCLGWGEAGGMGEGWGDFFATLIRHHGKNPHDWPMGSWAMGRASGIRHYPYSLSNKTNPSTYSYLDKPGYWGVHAIGEVWSECLFTVGEALIKKHGYSHTLYPPSTTGNATADDLAESTFYRTNKANGRRYPAHGNTLVMQLVIDGMKLQPCRPSFSDARDAILQADELLTGGVNACEIWTAFASRGLGPGAHVKGQTPWGGGVHIEDTTVPKKCR